MSDVVRVAEATWRVLGGRTAGSDEFLSCCCVGTSLAQGAVEWFGSAVLIHPRALLTAAHCQEFGTIDRAFLGSNKVNALRNAEIARVVEVVQHPLYVKPHHDLAVLILERPVSIKPADLADPGDIDRVESCELVGFGYNHPDRPFGFGVKRSAVVPIAALSRASEDDQKAQASFFGFDPEYEFVAGRKQLGIDTCEGDSGGPAYLEGRETVVGITSRAAKGRERRCGDGGVYVRVDRHRAWIDEVLARVQEAR